jgi:hypothetical protein
MSTYSCAADGIHRVDDHGSTLLCPPIVVLAIADDPERIAGKRIHVAWATAADAQWHEAWLPTAIVANDAALEAVLAADGWRPHDQGWHEAVIANALVRFDQPAEQDLAQIA